MKKKIMAMLAATLFCATSYLSCAATTVAADSKDENSSSATTLFMGDVNDDGSFNVADVVLFQKWLLGVPDAELINWRASDFCWDNRLNVFDLALMKRALLEKMNIDPNDDPEIYELLFGYNNESYGKPLPDQRLALKCKSYCELGETLKIDVAMGDTYSYHQQYSGYPTYDTLGHAEYGAYACDIGNYSKIENKKLTINGESSEYKKVYTKEEMESLDISGKFDDYGSYHHETAEIDFSNFTIGDSGSIVFYFHWVYDEENPDNPSSNISGMSKIVGYYVGEKGVVIGAGAEDAKSRYQSLFGSIPDEINEDEELQFGYNDENSSKPLPTQRLALKCKPYCDLGDTLKVDVAIGDTYSYHQEFGGYPTYDTLGHAEYGAYACDVGNYSKIENEKLTINGENSEYKKIYTKEEMESLDISGKFDDYDSYHHETAEIDFSNFSIGDSGSILFYFHWVYDEENPYNPSSKISGMSKIVGYYVGEKGVVIGAGAEDAKLRYRAIFGSLSDEDNEDEKIQFGYYDENYSKPLPTQRIAVQCKPSCDLDETLKIDVAMGDMYSYQQEHGGYPTYDTLGHAEYGIYACDAGTYKKVENEKLIINGEAAEYKKIYSEEELGSLDISDKVADYEAYHHETAEIDFSNFEIGDSGSIVFYFQWEYDEENPYNPSSNISGMSMIIGYYVGEKGVAIGAGAEDAQLRYQSIFG
jgi:hypothetical protein